jgi:acyl-coenzyme A thioesterase PaaI-like protein
MLADLLKLESASVDGDKSRTVFSFTVPRQMCNMAGTLHGGAVALIFDITTTIAITACSREDFWDSGSVSRNR